MPPETPPVLSDGRLSLRPPVSQDAPEIARCCDDPLIAEWIDIPSPYDVADARTYLHDRLTSAGWWLQPTWVIEDADGRLCGLIHLRLDGQGVADIGFLVASWARGEGIATAAVRLVSSWALRQGGQEVITWTGAVGNDASLAVATRAGFHIRPGIARSLMAHRDGRKDCWTGDLLAADLLERPRRRASDTLLTQREREVLTLMAEGASNRAIAGRMGLSENTVKNHVRSILAKLHADSRTAAVVRGVFLGLITLPT